MITIIKMGDRTLYISVDLRLIEAIRKRKKGFFENETRKS